ncbi:MAG: S-layer homology domain-containing protein, partial [Angelakisella sp.]
YTFSKTIHIYPTCDITVTANKNAHTDKAFTVKTTFSDNVTQQLNWHIFKNGKEVKWQDTVTGTLTNIGGSIQIKEQGSYTLKAVVHDETSRAFFGKVDVVVSPVIAITLQAPTTAHTDTMVAVSASTKELGNLNIIWSVTKDGKAATLSDCTEGKLTNDGGTVRFKEKGSYMLTATITDKAGRVFTAKAEITIYPVAAFSFTLPPTTHTDKAVNIVVKSAELQDMTAEWTVIYNGKVVKPAAVIDGVLTNEGGSIRFKEKGTYTLKATLFDKLGREYSHEATIIAYPIAETGFYLPTMTHTDTTVEVKTTFKDTENLTAVWSLTKNGKAISLTDGFVGTLTDKGGKIRFKEVGKYELKATVTDKTGRSFTYTAQTTIYPVITITLDLPKKTHTDRPVKATAKVTNGDTIPVRWKIMKGGIDEGVPDGVVANNDGNMHFT